MEITGKQLEDVLTKELVGQDVGYSNYKFSSAAIKAIRALADQAGFGGNNFTLEEQSSGSTTFYIQYKNNSIGTITYKKQRGNFNRGYFGSVGYYDWTFKEIKVSFWNETGTMKSSFQQALYKIDEKINKIADEEANRLKLAKQAYEFIKDLIDAEDKYDVTSFIKFMNEKRYELAD